MDFSDYIHEDSPDVNDFLDISGDYIKEEPLEGIVMPGPNVIGNANYGPKEFIRDMYQVFNRMGGMEWLYLQAQADPKGFMTMLRTGMPKNVNIEQDTELSVKLVDEFGQERADWTARQNADKTIEYVTPILQQPAEPDISEYLE